MGRIFCAKPSWKPPERHRLLEVGAINETFSQKATSWEKRAITLAAMAGGKKRSATSTQQETPEVDDLLSEEEFRKKFEPVAPWKRQDIPDRGPLQEAQHVLLFVAIGAAATLFYEFTECDQRLRPVFVCW